MHGPRGGGEAKLHYESGSFDIIVPGSYVICAVTGVQIPLVDLRYWDWEVQEAYASPEISFRRSEELRKQRK
ncbi:MAG: DUF2093 domain-containing protein [Alphaproteobacteria bacterium]|nr:DUF2093 domain-containing protein [Alphaproteobacteria bacterium]